MMLNGEDIRDKVSHICRRRYVKRAEAESSAGWIE